MLKNLIQENVLPTDPTKKKKKLSNLKKKIIKFKISNLIFSNNSFLSSEYLARTNVVHMFKCPWRDCVSNENNTYVGPNATTLSRRLTMHLNDCSTIDLHLKTHSIPKSKFRKIRVENTIIIAHEINKLRLQIQEALHIKKLKIATMFLNAFNLKKKNSIFLDNILLPLISFCF